MAEKNLEKALSPGHPFSGERVRRIPPYKKLQIYNRVTRIATWNTRSLYTAGKLANVDMEMNRLQIEILGLSEVRWPGTGKIKTKHGVLYYSGNNDPNHYNGVATLVSSSIEKSVIDFFPISDRLMVLKINTSRRVMNIVQVYAPTNDKDDNMIEEFYAELDEAMKLAKKGEITIIMGDFNAKVGAGAVGNVVGNFGLGDRNNRGDRLVQFCTEQQLSIVNTFFKLPPRRLYTWKSPTDCEEHRVRNQIDYILINTTFQKSVKSAKTYPGADINSDHNPVVMEINMRRFKHVNCPKPPKHIDITKLKNPLMKTTTAQNLEKRIQNIESSTIVEEKWTAMRAALIQTQTEDIGFQTQTKKQPWMTDEILKVMEERRQHKTTNEDRYRELNRTIRRKCREAKEQWLMERCCEIEQLQQKYDLHNVHKKINEITGRNRKKNIGILKDADNQILVGPEEKLKCWKEYVTKLFNDERPNRPPHTSEINETSPNITKEEVKHAVLIQKDGKAVGPDEVHAETLKLLIHEDGAGLSLLTDLFNDIYRTGKIPSDWLKSTFVTLPKKANASKCDDYRMISLMSHVLKTFLRVVHTRIYKKCEQQVNDTQFGFRNGLGTREALFSINVLTQRARDMNVEVYACFVDYRKAFDCVQHQKLAEILRATGVDEGDLRIITELYWHQTARVRVESSMSEEIDIRKGVRQGCILSPLLFNLYSENIFAEALQNTSAGIKINGKTINNLRYADDTVVIASSLSELQHLMDAIVGHRERYGLYINISKTKLMVFSKVQIPAVLRIHNNIVEQVSCFRYLGALVSSSCDSTKEILSRIEQARKTFITMKNFFIRRDLDLKLRIRMLRCYVFPVLLYGCECWTLNPLLEKRIEAFEMYLYRRILRIPWIDRITNIDVLDRMHKNKELMSTIKERKLTYIGHLMRGDRYEILRLIIEGKIQGKRSVGRRQNSWLKDLRRWLGKTSAEIFRAAISRVTIANWIANLRRETAQ